MTVEQIVAEREGREWCLFIDRDGVINRQIVGDYVRSWPDFEWLPGARLALTKLGEWAPHLVVVTNQQGIGKGLTSAEDVAAIHHHIASALESHGAAVDAFQVCPHLEAAECECRKPSPGLVLDWLARHPESEPALSIVVGDSLTDLELARSVAAATGGCVSIHIDSAVSSGIADASFESLWDFTVAVGHAREEQDK
jgi:histidinol-phosphate phosphatase family protein